MKDRPCVHDIRHTPNSTSAARRPRETQKFLCAPVNSRSASQHSGSICRLVGVRMQFGRPGGCGNEHAHVELNPRHRKQQQHYLSFPGTHAVILLFWPATPPFISIMTNMVSSLAAQAAVWCCVPGGKQKAERRPLLYGGLSLLYRDSTLKIAS
ncbi:hypothetical protein GQ43DRAFT_182552 [Delitschia confertaspora ATCC 74209]|uniref:Uncharacterized protein n=1 Tax=Delitschia confertaspora ATCC 74209 TaxID=1513339 RepID=A0A9P4JTU2_9PLEO|nr:hypothetical protein GQ43DRAFT_182552 [Delitschia confertaspora ATCC 74209]